MKAYSLLISLCIASGYVHAQSSGEDTPTPTLTRAIKIDTSYWQKSFSGGVNFNQVSLSNWVGGGVNSMALGGVVAARALYVRDRASWDNTADLQLGFVRQAGLTRKAADQILLNSVYGYKIAPKYDLFASGTFNTFFLSGYQYDQSEPFRVSNFLAPAQITMAIGVAYKPTEWFSLRFSPLAPRFTILADDGVRFSKVNGVRVYDRTAKAYGVEPGKSVRTEIGFFLQTVLNRNITENININARYQAYGNYQTLDAIDHRIDLLATAKINRFISTTFGLIALYDKDFSNDWQLQQTLSVGLLYNVSTFRKK